MSRGLGDVYKRQFTDEHKRAVAVALSGDFVVDVLAQAAHLALRDLTLEEFPREVGHGAFTFLNHRLEERDGLQNVGMKPIQQADQHRNQHQNHRAARDNADEIAEAG